MTALCMSGGRDSTAVFGAGRDALRKRSDPRRLRAISVSYPPGDPGREDEYIEAIMRHWGEEPRWVPVAPLLGRTDLFFAAAGRDEPHMFPFEPVNRALARKTLSLQTRLMLDGNGGDQAFGASTRYFADLLRTGRWLTLAQEWKAEGAGDFRAFFRSAIRPNLTPGMLRVAKAVRGGRPLASPPDFYRKPIRWASESFVRDHRLVDFERAAHPARDERDIAAYELYWHLTYSMFANDSHRVSEAVREVGVEIRSPLLDERVVRFMAAQPVRERRSKAEEKWLLRRAMRGLIPDEVLARRTRKTGRPTGYIRALMKALGESPAREWIERPLLGELGVVDASALKRAATWIFSSDSRTGFEVPLYFTLYVEQWLRTRLQDERFPAIPAGAAAVSTA